MMMNEMSISEIPVGSIWRHYNGCIYIVLNHANTGVTSTTYEPMVVYRGPNKSTWVRPAADWFRSMTRITTEGHEFETKRYTYVKAKESGEVMKVSEQSETHKLAEVMFYLFTVYGMFLFGYWLGINNGM